MKINIHTSHPSAFISSTFVDLYEERATVANVLKVNGLNVNALDVKPASTDSSKDQIKRGIKESDFVILIIGDRYGAIMPRMTGSEILSVTRWEYNEAWLHGKPVIAFFQNSSYFDVQNCDDKGDPLYIKKREQFKRFKEIVAARHNPAYFSHSSDLADQIQKSLIPTYRSGVEKLVRKNSELREEIAALKGEVEKLKSQKKETSTETHTNPLLGLSKGLGPFGK